MLADGDKQPVGLRGLVGKAGHALPRGASVAHVAGDPRDAVDLACGSKTDVQWRPSLVGDEEAQTKEPRLRRTRLARDGQAKPVERLASPLGGIGVGQNGREEALAAAVGHGYR